MSEEGLGLHFKHEKPRKQAEKSWGLRCTEGAGVRQQVVFGVLKPVSHAGPHSLPLRSSETTQVGGFKDRLGVGFLEPRKLKML